MGSFQRLLDWLRMHRIACRSILGTAEGASQNDFETMGLGEPFQVGQLGR